MGKITPFGKTIIVLVAFLGFTNFNLSGSKHYSPEHFSRITLGAYNLDSKPSSVPYIRNSSTSFNKATAIVINGTVNDVSCFNDNDGSIEITISGGSSPYIFSWVGRSEVTKDISSIPAGSYTLLVTDANNDTQSKTFTVAQPNNLTISNPITTPVSCNGGNDGSATAGNASGGNGGYKYKIEGGSYSASKTFSNLSEGTYTIFVRDSKGCEISQTVTVTEPELLIMNEPTYTNYICVGASNGSATSGSVSGGNGDYQYKLNNGNYSSTNTFSNLSKGTYTITVKDSEDCETSKIFTIEEYPTATVTKPVNIVACNNELLPPINFSGSSVAGTTYKWENNNPAIGLVSSGAGNIPGFTVENTSSSPITAEVTVTPIANDCEGTPQTFEILVNPTPEVNKPEDLVVCDGDSIEKNILAGSTVNGTTYRWENSNPAIGLAASGTGDIPDFTATNITNNVITATITIIPEATDCSGIEKKFTITVNPTPTVQKPNDIVVCDGSPTSPVTLHGSSVTGTTYRWTNSNVAIGLPANGEGNIPSFTAANNSENIVTAEISVIPVANDCEGIPETFTITVNPFPTVTAPDDQVYCNGTATEIIPLPEGKPSGVVYDISGAAIGLSNKTNVTEIPSFTALAGYATVTITPKANGCTGTAVTYKILVNPTPTVSISPASQAICSGRATNFNLSGSVAGTTFNWTVAEITPTGSVTGASDGTGNKIEQTLTNSITSTATVKYKIIPIGNECEGAPIFVTATVNPTPVLEITNPETACSPAEVDLTAMEITAGSSPGLIFTYWKNEAATSQLNNPSKASAGTFYIKATSGSGCSIVKPVIVTENQSPQLTSPLQAQGFCSETAFVYEFTSNVPETKFSWNREFISGISTPANSDSGNINEVLVNETTNPIIVSYAITLISPDGCTSTTEISTTVTPTPLMTSTLTPEGVCSGVAFEYVPTSETGGTVFSWKREAVDGISNPAANGNGSINEVLENTTTQAIGVTYTYTLSSNNCENPREYNVNVIITPSPDTQVQVTAAGENNKQDEIEICPGESVDLFSSTSFPNNPSLPSEVLNSNFNNGNQGWTTQQSNTNRRWRLTDDGEEAYSQCGYEGPWWDREYTCNTYDFHSNDNSRFFSVNSNNYDGDFNNVGLTSPIFSTQGYSNLELSFWHHYRDGGASRYSQRDIGYLEYRFQNSNGDWTNWRNLDTFTSTTGEPDNFEKWDENVNQLINQDAVQIRFRYHNANSDWYWAIDNISITGDGTATPPEVQWTADGSDWISNEENPTNISPSQTTIYTATYIDPVTGCPGSASVKVVVRQPPPVTITANYCGDSSFIELISDNEFSSYRWESGGEVLGTERNLNVEIASTYTLTVTDEYGCSGSGSINVSHELIVNGDFEDGLSGFYTDYRNKTGTGDLYPEGDFAVDDNARDYHNDFNGRDHTTGNGNFMIINGAPGSGKVIWRQTIENIQPNTDYYFNAWGMNVNPKTPARLQFRVNGQPTGTVADLRGQPVGTWVKFYSNPFWNSGNATSAILEIINLETIRDGNDFGIDDISFGTLEPIVFSIDPTNNSPLCDGSTLELFANITGGRAPINFTWTNEAGDIISTEENPVLENVTSGDSGVYTLSVTDAFGCAPTTGTTTVKVYSEIIVTAGEDFAICAETVEIPLNGSITGSVSTGTWSGGNGVFAPNNKAFDAIYTPSTEEIAAGEVTLTLTSDVLEEQDNPCPQVLDTITITINPTPEITLTKTDLSCFEANDGTATVNFDENAGTAPFTYLWSDGQTTQTAIGLSAGEYSVEVFDANNCSASQTIILHQPTPLEIIETAFTQPTCYSGVDGTATITVDGGIIPDITSPLYSYFITDAGGNEVARLENSASSTFIAEGLSAGNYTFTVSIANGCSSTAISVTVIQPDPILADTGPDIDFEQCGVLSTILAANSPGENETGLWTVLEGTGGSFSNDTSKDSEFTGLPSTSYTLAWTVTNDAGCVNYDEVVVTFPESCSTLDFDGIDDHITFGDNYNLSGAFSVEAWIKPHSTSGIKTILSRRNSDDINSGGYDLILNNGFPTFRINGTSVTTNFKVNTTRWHHIAGTFDGSTARLYVDGIELKNLNSPAGPKSITAPFLIGAMNKNSSTIIPGSNFEGWIEEVRLWNKAISTDQIRFMMNQRIKDSGKVRGVEIPFDVPGNINWSDLAGYYQMTRVENGFVLGETNASVKGKLVNITTSQENTAPLPYYLYTENNGDWNVNSTWQLPEEINGKDISQRNVWEHPNSLGLDRTTKIGWNIVRLAKNVKNPGTPNNTNEITLLGLISEGATLDMKGENNLSGNGLTITHYLKLDGFIDLNGESQLIQSEGSILDEASSGKIQRDQQGTKNSFNYNYWNSPVSIQKTSNNSGFKIASVLKDGSDKNNPQDISFGAPHTFADNPYTGNLRISSYWLNIFHGTADDYGQWHHITPDVLLPAGTGYTMKGTSGAAPIKEDQNYTFTGKPNNGTITLAISNQENRLVGNPYPSAIDMVQFIQDNLKDIPEGKNTKNVFNGAIYFWDHFGKEDTHNLAEYVGGYATYNLSGGTPGVSNDRRINSNGNGGSNRPGRWIPVGQGFFVNTAMDEGVAGNYNIHGGNITFKNSQRIYVRENPGYSSFLRPEIVTKEKQAVFTEDERFKIRLDFKSPSGYNRQILVTADPVTTNEFDLAYDAPLIDDIPEDMFWVINSSPFVIQAVSNFDVKQVLPLGIKISTDGEFSIAIAELENIPEEVKIYLKDKETNTYQDLREEKFLTNTEIGYFPARYEIVFQKQEEAEEEKPDETDEDQGKDVKDEIVEEEILGQPTVSYLDNNQEILVKNPELYKINKIILHGLTGQVIEEYNNIETKPQIFLPVRSYSSAVYVIKMYTDQGIIQKKIIINN